MQMLVTSVTSSVAFAACVSSPIMPIKSFGIFSTIIVLVCFAITMIMLPFGYFIYEKKYFGVQKEDPRLMSNDLEDYVQSENTGII